MKSCRPLSSHRANVSNRTSARAKFGPGPNLVQNLALGQALSENGGLGQTPVKSGGLGQAKTHLGWGQAVSVGANGLGQANGLAQALLSVQLLALFSLFMIHDMHPQSLKLPLRWSLATLVWVC